jgi:hypothetical protein
MANGKGIAYVGLILGLIGAGLGGYVFFDYTLSPMLGLTEPTSTLEINSYYAEAHEIVVSSTGTYVSLSGLMISFTTTKSVSLHILYTAYVRIITANGDYVYIKLALNGTELNTNAYYIEEFNVATYERFAINMQHYIPSLQPGSYNITVLVNLDHTSTRFYKNSLYAQTHT